MNIVIGSLPLGYVRKILKDFGNVPSDTPMCHLPFKLPSKVRWSTRFKKKKSPKKQLLLYSFTSEEKKLYLSPFHVHSFLFRWDGIGKKKEVVLETELERGLEEHCAKTSTSPNKLGLRWGRSGRRWGERERGMRGEEWSRRWGTFFSFPNPAVVGEKYMAGLEFLGRSLTWT